MDRFKHTFSRFLPAILLGLCMLSSEVWGQYTENDIYIYIERYGQLAVDQMRTYKIPASITIAQGLLESAAGTSNLATEANNHFGIKCHTTWKGETFYKNDDQANECFRKYASAEESFKDHCDFLQAKRYASLFSLEQTDYKGWAEGLKKCGYATNPKYPERLITLIEKYRLGRLDTMALYGEGNLAGLTLSPNTQSRTASPKPSDTQSAPKKASANFQPTFSGSGGHTYNEARKSKEEKEKGKAKHSPLFGKHHPAAPVPNQSYGETYYMGSMPEPVDYPYTQRTVYENNGTYFVIAKKGDTYLDIAIDVQQPLASIKLFNDIPSNRYEPVEGEWVYIERKPKYSSRYRQHMVTTPVESLRDICQRYGCRMSSIMELNQLERNILLEKGQVIWLQKK